MVGDFCEHATEEGQPPRDVHRGKELNAGGKKKVAHRRRTNYNVRESSKRNHVDVVRPWSTICESKVKWVGGKLQPTRGNHSDGRGEHPKSTMGKASVR